MKATSHSSTKINSSTLSNQGSSVQTLVSDNRPYTIAQRQVMAMNSPRTVAQRQAFAEAFGNDTATDSKPNTTGMPDALKAGLENMSGFDMSDVKVHYNSTKPAELQALAYAQGNEIHLGPGQEEHLPHEGWHVVQQRQGRVRPMVQMKGVNINNSNTLEEEADRMGNKASQISITPTTESFETNSFIEQTDKIVQAYAMEKDVIQCMPSLGDVWNFIKGVWNASTWTGILSSLSTLIKFIAGITQGGNVIKIAGLGADNYAKMTSMVKACDDYENQLTTPEAKEKARLQMIEDGTNILTNTSTILILVFGTYNPIIGAITILIDKIAAKWGKVESVYTAGVNAIAPEPVVELGV